MPRDSALIRLLKPETDLERELLQTPEFQTGMSWGEPRFGHPEGKVCLHVREVLDNINAIASLTPEDRSRLRLAAMAHDTFKYLEDRSRPRNWERHHGALARRFMALYTSDQVLLDLIECHDDAFYAWLWEKSEAFRVENPHKSLDSLLYRFDGALPLYAIFFRCDTLTGDKILAPLKWFEQRIAGAMSY